MPEIMKLVEIGDRPWGVYETTSEGYNFKTKTITVKSGQRLSKQWHHHREEHWIVASGQGIVEVNGIERKVHAGSYVHIPKKAIHRVTNNGAGNLVFCEVQLGEYLKEDDIVRVDDDYGRESE